MMTRRNRSREGLIRAIAPAIGRRLSPPFQIVERRMQFNKMAVLAVGIATGWVQFGFAPGWQALLAKGTVNWRPGDEFEATRLRGGNAQ
jgi:hypothetical protein